MKNKKNSFIVYLMVAAIFLISTGYAALSTASAAETAILVFGDVDHDGQTTSADALVVLRTSIGLEQLDEGCQKIADVDNDSSITSSDALAILRYSIGYQFNESDISKDNVSEFVSSKATSSKATSSKATSSKATSSKATSSKATSSKTSNEPGSGHGNYKIILNTKTKKYHTHECTAAKKILAQNKKIYYVETPRGSSSDYRYLESFGYDMCGICKKQ